jgi:hypothetical protein
LNRLRQKLHESIRSYISIGQELRRTLSESNDELHAKTLLDKRLERFTIRLTDSGDIKIISNALHVNARGEISEESIVLAMEELEALVELFSERVA